MKEDLPVYMVLAAKEVDDILPMLASFGNEDEADRANGKDGGHKSTDAAKPGVQRIRKFSKSVLTKIFLELHSRSSARSRVVKKVDEDSQKLVEVEEYIDSDVEPDEDDVENGATAEEDGASSASGQNKSASSSGKKGADSPNSLHAVPQALNHAVSAEPTADSASKGNPGTACTQSSSLNQSAGVGVAGVSTGNVTSSGSSALDSCSASGAKADGSQAASSTSPRKSLSARLGSKSSPVVDPTAQRELATCSVPKTGQLASLQHAAVPAICPSHGPIAPSAGDSAKAASLVSFAIFL